MRICKRDLEATLAMLNFSSGSDYELDHAACYGGYALTCKKGSSRLTERMSSREMWLYLRGAVDFVSVCDSRK